MSNNSITPRTGLFDRIFLNDPFSSIFPNTNLISHGISDYINSAFTSIKKSFPYPYDILVEYDDEHNTIIGYTINIALAGFYKEELKVRLVKSKTLTLEINPMVDTINNCEYLVQGIAKRAGTISWTLSPKIDLDKFKSVFKDGILTINLPIIKEQQEPEEVVLSID